MEKLQLNKTIYGITKAHDALDEEFTEFMPKKYTLDILIFSLKVQEGILSIFRNNYYLVIWNLKYQIKISVLKTNIELTFLKLIGT